MSLAKRTGSPHRFKKFFQQDFTGSNGFEFIHDWVSLMVIHDFNIFCNFFIPIKTDTPLIVDTNTVLAVTITFECFKTISGRHSQIIYPTGNLKLSQLPAGQ